jgi:ComF family protein
MSIINDFLSLIYPSRCEACSDVLFRHERFLCNYCKLNLPRSDFHLRKDNPLSLSLTGRVEHAYATSCFVYEKCGRIQRLIHAIKYQNQKELAEYIGTMYAEVLLNSKCFEDVNVIVPVPLHQNKLKARGFNQSECFAKGLSKAMFKPLDCISLIRIKETASQTNKKKYERWENVEGIFDLSDLRSLENKHILLVDDVVTTGATIEAAYLALKKTQGIRISIASIAFAYKGF